MTAPQPTLLELMPTGARKLGYFVAIAVNTALIYVVDRLLIWDWPSFLTPDYVEVAPVIRLSLGASIIVNLAYMLYDPAWFKSAGQIGLAVIGFVVVSRLLAVFPFEFSGYAFDWDPLVRLGLIFLLAVVVLGVIVEGVKLIRGVVRDTDGR